MGGNYDSFLVSGSSSSHSASSQESQAKVEKGQKFLERASNLGGRILNLGKRGFTKTADKLLEIKNEVKHEASEHPTNTLVRGGVHVAAGLGLFSVGSAIVVAAVTGGITAMAAEPITGSILLGTGLAAGTIIMAVGIGTTLKGALMVKESHKQAWKEMKSYVKDRTDIKEQQKELKDFANECIKEAKNLDDDAAKVLKKDIKKITNRQMWSFEDVQKARIELKQVLKGVSQTGDEFGDLAMRMHAEIDTGFKRELRRELDPGLRTSNQDEYGDGDSSTDESSTTESSRLDIPDMEQRSLTGEKENIL